MHMLAAAGPTQHVSYKNHKLLEGSGKLLNCGQHKPMCSQANCFLAVASYLLHRHKNEISLVIQLWQESKQAHFPKC